MQFRLEASERQCYLGHVDTFEIEGVDPVSAKWLSDWTLWCRTCEALVADVVQSAEKRLFPRRRDVVGYVVSVPMAMTIVDESMRKGRGDEGP